MPPKKSKKDKSKKQKVSNDQHTTDPSRKASETSFSGPEKLFDDDPAQERQGASDSPKPKKDKKWKVHLPNALKTKKSKSKNQHPEEMILSPQSEEGNKRKYHVTSPSSGVPSEIEQHESESLVGISTLSESPPRPSANRVPSLECYSRPTEEQLSPVDGSAHMELLSSPLSEDEEEGRTIGVKKPPDIPGMERAAQRSRDSGARFLPRINKLRDDLSSTRQKLEQKQSDLEDLLSSKESAFDILRKKLDQRDLDYEKHLKMKLDDMKESYEDSLRNKEKLHKDVLEQEQRIYEGKLADKEQELKDKLASGKDQYEAVVQSELATKEELQKLQQDLKGIKQELVLKESEKKNLDQQLASIREEHALKLKQEDERIDGEKKATDRVHTLENQLTELRRELDMQVVEKKDLETKFAEQLKELEEEKKELLLAKLKEEEERRKEEMERDYQELKKEHDLRIEQLKEEHQKILEQRHHKELMQREKASESTEEGTASSSNEGKDQEPEFVHTETEPNTQLKQDVATLKEEVESLSKRLNTKRKDYNELQVKYDLLCQQCKQPEVLTDAAYKLPTLTTCELTDLRPVLGTSSHNEPSTEATNQVALNSSVVHAANEIAKFVDGEVMLTDSNERSITREASLQIAKALGKDSKPLSYVFAIFPAYRRSSSLVLDFTTAAVFECPASKDSVQEAESGDDEDFKPARDTFVTEEEQESPQDNRTDAEKLRDEVEELKRNAKQDIAAHQQKIEELQAQIETLSHQLSDLSASNLHLKEVIKTAIEEAPPSADGVEPGDEGKTDKLLNQIRAKYLEQSMRIVEFQEVYQKQNAELAQCKAKLNEWQERYSRKKKELEEKVKERDLQLKEQRQSNAPPTSSLDHFETDCACKGPEHEADLKATLKKKDEEIQSLTIQLHAFQEVSSQRQKLHEHSKTQSTVVVQLRKDLEAAHQELEVVRSKSESAKTIDALHKKIIQVNEELRDLKLEKNVVEDELDILKKECEAAEKAHQSTRHELAQSQSSIASLRAVQEKGKATLVADEGSDLTEMNILRGQARLYQIEVVELQRKEKRYKATLSELGKSKMAQERKLKYLQEERDLLAQQNMEHLATKQTYKGQLDKFGDLKTQVEVTREHMSALADTIVTKTEEIEALEVKVKGLEDELEATKFQAFQYEQDFEEERQARADAVGARNSDYGQFSHQVQSLTEQLEQAKSETEIERKEKQAVISKLEVNFATSQRLNRQLEQAERDFKQALEAKSEELKNEKTDNTQLKTSLTKLQEQNTELTSNVAKLQEQLQRAETTYLQRQGELLQQLKDFEHEAKDREGELQEKAQMFAVQKLSLNEQLEKVTEELKAKEKQLEITAAEKQVIEERLESKTEHIAALTQELSETKANGDRFTIQLQEARERLDSALADSARLHDDVLAKTAQVKQYKKQTDSFKLKVEEANDRLLKTQSELQRCQKLIKTMEEDQQDQIEQARLNAETEKLTTETKLVQAQRRIDALERQVYDLTSEGGQGSEALRVEIERKREIEQKLDATQAKYGELMDKCDSRYQAMEKLKKLLTQHGIALPKLEIDKVTPVGRQSSSERRLSPHQGPYSQTRGGAQQTGHYDRDATSPTSPILSNQDIRQQRPLPSPQYHQMDPTQSLPRRYTAPQSLVPQSDLAGQLPPQGRIQEDGGTYRSDGQQRAHSQFNQAMPRVSQPPPSSGPPLDTGPPLRAQDPRAQDPNYHHQYRGEQQSHQNHQYGPQQSNYHSDPNFQQNQYYPDSGQGYRPSEGNQGQHQYPPNNLQYQPHPQPYQQQPEYAQGNYPQNHPQANYQTQRNYPQNPEQERFQQNQGYSPGQRPLHQKGAGSNQMANTPTTMAPVFGTNLPPPQPPQAQGGPQPPTPTPRKSANNSSPPQKSSRVPSTKRPRQDSGVQENALLEGIDRDIKEAAYYVIQEGEVLESMAFEAPFDPNLICPLCMRNFRVGEIQKYKKHVNSCQGQI